MSVNFYIHNDITFLDFEKPISLTKSTFSLKLIIKHMNIDVLLMEYTIMNT